MKYNTDHKLTESSNTTAIGPGIVDYSEWADFYYEITKKIQNLDYLVRKDITKMIENTQHTWIEYSAVSLKRKKHQEDLHKKFLESKKSTETFLTIAILRSPREKKW